MCNDGNGENVQKSYRYTILVVVQGDKVFIVCLLPSGVLNNVLLNERKFYGHFVLLATHINLFKQPSISSANY